MAQDEPGRPAASAADGDGAAEPSFDRAFEGLRATGASVEIRNLVELLARHGSEEGRLLAEYENLAASSADKGVKYVIGLLLQDEHRHHRQLAEMANSMAWDAVDDEGGTSVPALGWHLDPELAAQTRRLREYEEQDRRELESLRKRLRPFASTTLWGLIVDTMLLDTEKHAVMLRFLERYARQK